MRLFATKNEHVAQAGMPVPHSQEEAYGKARIDIL